MLSNVNDEEFSVWLTLDSDAKPTCMTGGELPPKYEAAEQVAPDRFREAADATPIIQQSGLKSQIKLGLEPHVSD